MCCLGRYKGVILLLGTSPLRSHFISPFSLHRSLYLISYSRVWLPQTSRTPFIFIWKTHLVLEGWQWMEVKSRGFWCGRGPRQVSLSHVNVLLQGFFTVPICRQSNFIFLSIGLISATSFSIIKKNLFKHVQFDFSPPLYFLNTSLQISVKFASIQWNWYSWTAFTQSFETADRWKSVPFIRQPRCSWSLERRTSS